MTKRASLAAVVFVAAILPASACEVLAPTTPQGLTIPVAASPVTAVFQIGGRVVDADSSEAIPGAVAFASGFCAPGNCADLPAGYAPGAVTDGQGVFALKVSLQPDWRELMVSVQPDGYRPTRNYVAAGAEALLTVHPAKTIRAGESLETHVFPGAESCGGESWSCRRFIVDLLPGESIDLELLLLEGQTQTGLVVGPENGHPFSPNAFPTRVTMTAGEVWIYGAPGRLKLVAHRR